MAPRSMLRLQCVVCVPALASVAASGNDAAPQMLFVTDSPKGTLGLSAGGAKMLVGLTASANKGGNGRERLAVFPAVFASVPNLNPP